MTDPTCDGVVARAVADVLRRAAAVGMTPDDVVREMRSELPAMLAEATAAISASRGPGRPVSFTEKIDRIAAKYGPPEMRP